MNKKIRNNLVQVVFLALVMGLITFAVDPFLPVTIPVVSWTGETMNLPKFPYLYLIPFFILLGGILLETIVLTDPRQKHLINSNNAYHHVVLVILVLLMLLDITFLTEHLGISLPFMKLSTLLFGFALIFIGNQLPKLKPNHILGFKTPWAMDNDIVWIKTHRFAGYLFFFGGFFTLITPLLPTPIDLIGGAFIFLTLLISPIIYSYLYYAKKGSTHDQ